MIDKYLTSQVARSWVSSANEPANGFPLQNLPYCAFNSESGSVHLGVGIGTLALDLYKASAAGLLDSLGTNVAEACQHSQLNSLMMCGPAAWAELRSHLTDLLIVTAPRTIQSALQGCLLRAEGLTFCLPVAVGDYTDFYASIEHATNVGRLFRPDQPLLPNYVYVPIGYHGRASSLRLSGHPIYRPYGQVKGPSETVPTYRPSSQLDYELEVGAYIGWGNPLGITIPVRSAESHIFGFSLLNDWSARDIQSWEYQPLGPFLGKNFGTTLSPWVVSTEALAPFRVPRALRANGNPEALRYLEDGSPDVASAIDLTLEVYLSTPIMNERSLAPKLISKGNLRNLYWSFAQLVAHHTSNGCNLNPGDLLGSGTVSGSEPGSEGSLLEITKGGKGCTQIPTGETRTFLEDGDEIIFRGYCERPPLPRIGLGECRGTVYPPRS